LAGQVFLWVSPGRDRGGPITERQEVSKEVKLTFRYEQDSKRYHRFKIIEPEGNITGDLGETLMPVVKPGRNEKEKSDRGCIIPLLI